MFKDRDYLNTPGTAGSDSNDRQEETRAGVNAGAQPFPSVSLPKGGGAIRGIGEKFTTNAVTGTGSIKVPLAVSPGRSGFAPQLALSYDSGAGNGSFGFGWSLSLPAVTRKTDKGLPQYRDAEESDVFILAGAEDLVPVLIETNGSWIRETLPPRNLNGENYEVQRYRPRVEGLFARVERWMNLQSGDSHWRSITRDNITTLYGKDDNSRIFAPATSDPQIAKRIFSWLICESYDDKGNAIVYEYSVENDRNVDRTLANESNRVRGANRYLKRIKYGNRVSHLRQPDLTIAKWLFEVVFDYEEGHYEVNAPNPEQPEAEQHQLVLAAAAQGLPWTVRPDPFSSYRAGFEVRIHRRCHRVLMFHRFDELGAEPYLVRSTEFEYADFDYSHPTTIESELAHPGSSRFGSFIRGVIQSGYVRDDNQPVLERNGVKYLTYIKKSLPPVEFVYSRAVIQEEIEEVTAESIENLPIGLDGSSYHWVDLDGEALSGVLTEQGNAWFYKRNLSPLPLPGEDSNAPQGARFAPLERLASMPLPANLAGGQQFMDLAGDGQLDVVDFGGSIPGFSERTSDEDWQQFRSFASLPNIRWMDQNLRFVDLTGDGLPDVLITEDEVFTWHSSLGEEGFGPAEKVRQALDEDKGPRLLFADGTQSVYLADMSGDGLTDVVRIRNGEVAYWPNVGYGRFGAKVVMDASPWFDTPDQFDQRRIRLADIDGSGVGDIIYLRRDGVRLYLNQSGNRWSDVRPLKLFPRIDDLSAITVVDLLGNGTACLVWSSPLAADIEKPMRYLRLMKEKAHLLTGVVNNLGAETRVRYAPSTKFYLADKAAGKPWITRLPFVVHVVEQVETYDYVGRNRCASHYTYHHGYFDGIEREFRGFGMVEQWDTEMSAALTGDSRFPEGENVNEVSRVPPLHTKTWFHTGVYLGRDRVSQFFAGLLDTHDRGEYYREPNWRDNDVEARKRLLEDTVLPARLTAAEQREACRALKGSMLRQEVYGEDGTVKAQHPYAVTEQNFTVKRLQPQDSNRHGVFFTHAREAVKYHYERNPTDPRITHALTLTVDEYGNVLRSVAAGYRREDVPDRQPEQNETHLTLTLNRVVSREDQMDWRHIGIPVETRTYEVVKPPVAAFRFVWEELRDLFEALVPLDQVEPLEAKTIPYEQWDWRKQWIPLTEPGGLLNTRLRLIEHVRNLYRPDDLGVAPDNVLALLTLGTVESLALLGESYKLAFTPGLLAKVYQRPLDLVQPPGSPPAENLLPNAADVLNDAGADRGGYVDLDNDGRRWIPSGRMFFSPGAADTPTEELAYAGQHFFRAHRQRDPFHTTAVSTESFVSYDAYDLLLLETRDALDNRMTVGERDTSGALAAPGNNYRVLQPRLVMDPNRNRTEVAFDALGMVVGTAVMAKPLPAPVEGDSLDAFEADLTEAVILDHMDNPLADPRAILRNATTRLAYDLFAFKRTKDNADPRPVVVYTLERETHASDPVPAGGLKIRHSLSYSDGFGREIQKKIQAEAGPVPRRDADGKIVLDANGQPEMTPGDSSPRWVGSGWTIFNNKGKPFRQYEPFFTDTHRFEFEVRIGVSPILCYDPVERVVATLHPNHTWEKVLVDPWKQETWDVSDTVTLEPQNDPDVKGFFVYADGTPRVPAAEYLPTWSALRTDPAHAAEANRRWPDATILNAERNAAEKAAIHAETPTRTHFDALGRAFLTVAHNKFKYGDTPPAAPPTEEFQRTHTIFDIEGNQREIVDARDRAVIRYEYDILGNRIHLASMEGGERWMLNDATGKPIRAWDSRTHVLRTEYDPLRRPVRSFVIGADPANPNQELLTERLVYGEQHPEDELRNLRGRLFLHLDQAGLASNHSHDFKGNLQRSSRRLAREYKQTLNWKAVDAVFPAVPTKLNAATVEAALAPLLEVETYTQRTLYDAPNRPIQIIAPRSDQPGAKRNITQPVYNEANLLERLDVWLDHPTEPTGLLDAALTPPSPVGVNNIDYNAKGQRLRIEYKNGATTRYVYEPETLRLIHLYTRRGATFTEDCGSDLSPRFAAPDPSPPSTPCGLQNIRYTHDSVGNLTHIRDDAQQAIYFSNRRVEPSAEYTYDSVYRLIEATGREHLGQVGDGPRPGSYNDKPRVGILLSATDGNAVGGYLQRYRYDTVGNFREMAHLGTSPVNSGWTRSYTYNEDSQLQATQKSNRLTSTTVGAITETYSSGGNSYDAHGNMLGMPQLQVMQWNFRDQLQMTQRQAMNADDKEGTERQGERTWYVYDASGQRVRKVTEAVADQIKEERVYLGGFEVYRRRGVNPLVRETLHVMDDKRRIALVETRVQGAEDGVPVQVIRYQFGNHLGSASLELDHQAAIISYEEYYPYGNTSFQAVRSRTETPKRYRYTGKERDEESGLYYQGARYYAAWLGRWTGCDPAGTVDGLSLYVYVRDDPLRLKDPSGMQGNHDDENDPSNPLNQPVGGWGVGGDSFLAPAPHYKLDPPNFLSSSYSQSLGIITSGAGDVEANLYLGGLQLSGLGPTQVGGGLQNAQLQIRQQIAALPGFDLGATIAGSYLSQGTISGESQTRGISGALLAHYARKAESGFGGGGYLTIGGGGQRSTGGPWILTPTVAFTGVLGYEPEPPEEPAYLRLRDLRRPPESPYHVRLAGIDINPAVTYAGRGQLSQGPLLSDLYTLGGYFGVGIAIGRQFVLLPEVGGFYSHGSADTASGSQQTGESGTWRVGLAATYSWIQRTGSGPQTSSVSFGAWFTQERGSISGPSTADSPSGPFITNTITFGATFGFRRNPLLGQ
jgi:RHS repeat-associated protein